MVGVPGAAVGAASQAPRRGPVAAGGKPPPAAGGRTLSPPAEHDQISTTPPSLRTTVPPLLNPAGVLARPTREESLSGSRLMVFGGRISPPTPPPRRRWRPRWHRCPSGGSHGCRPPHVPQVFGDITRAKPIPESVRYHAPLAAGTNRGCPSWCREAMPHHLVPPARLARRGPVCIPQGLHGAPLPHFPRFNPLRQLWQGRVGFSFDGRQSRVLDQRRCTCACATCRLDVRDLLQR